jgi:hypothetical protein
MCNFDDFDERARRGAARSDLMLLLGIVSVVAVVVFALAGAVVTTYIVH